MVRITPCRHAHTHTQNNRHCNQNALNGVMDIFACNTLLKPRKEVRHSSVHTFLLPPAPSSAIIPALKGLRPSRENQSARSQRVKPYGMHYKNSTCKGRSAQVAIMANVNVARKYLTELLPPELATHETAILVAAIASTFIAFLGEGFSLQQPANESSHLSRLLFCTCTWLVTVTLV